VLGSTRKTLLIYHLYKQTNIPQQFWIHTVAPISNYCIIALLHYCIIAIMYSI
jgi:hypothetical protein